MLTVAMWVWMRPLSQHLSGAGSSPAASVSRNLQKLHNQYLTTSVAVVLVVR